jgi:hypothetical protein
VTATLTFYFFFFFRKTSDMYIIVEDPKTGELVRIRAKNVKKSQLEVLEEYKKQISSK